MTVSEEVLSRFVAEFPASDIPQDVIDRAVEACVDCLGVALAGSRAKPATLFHRQLEKYGGGDGVTVLGTGLRASPLEGSLANGIAAHALDFDDMGSFGHPSTSLLPAILAVAELTNASGRALLEAYTVGFEVGAALHKGLGISRGETGLHTTGIIGVFSATAGVARLLGLTPEQVTMAMGVVASTTSGLVQNFGTDTKSMHAGLAARNAVMAAQLAQDGFNSNPAYLEGAGGMLAVFGRGDHQRLRSMLEDLGKKWAMPETLTLKRFPCCGSTHAAITAVQNILAETPFSPSEIESVEVGELPPASHVLLYPDPVDGFQGKFSIEFATARALCDGGNVTVESFAGDGGTSSPEYRNVLDRLRVKVGPKWRHGTEAAFANTTVTVRLSDGRTVSNTVNRYEMPGTPKSRLTPEQIREKFEANCARAGLDGGALYGLWSRLPEMASVREGLATTVPAGVA